MDKINLILDVVKISLKFDDALQSDKFCDLQGYADEMNGKIAEFNNGDISNFDEEILDLIDKLSQINTYAIEHIAKNCNKSHKKGLNTLLLFYSDKCPASINFFPVWKELKSQLKGRINLIAVNCKDKKHEEICKFFKIYEYPTIKYVTPTKIHDYFGEMTKDDIIKTFLLI